MRTKTKNRNLNDQRVKQLNTQKHKSIQNVRKKVKECDLEKAAIIYLHLFMNTKDVEKIDYSTFHKTWVEWFTVDAYGCNRVIKKSFSKTVQCEGNTEESIRSYRDSVKIFNLCGWI